MTFDPTKVDLWQTIPPAVSVTGNTITWAVNGLTPFVNQSFIAVVGIHSPTDPQPCNVGDILHFGGNVVGLPDEVPADNPSSADFIVTASADPNNMTVREGESVAASQTGDYLHYDIHFQNVGTAAAWK